jgi:tetratricopeptide (TPR) repeat protein/predicted transcriptional regulator
MGDESDLDAWMETVAHRVEFLELLGEAGPMAPRDVVDAVEYSRPTVTRVLRELREADLVEQGTNGYSPTLAGQLAAEEYRRHETASDAIRSADDLLAPIPAEHAPPVDVLVGADVISTETAVPVRALETVTRRVQEAESVRAYLPTLVDTHFLRVWHRAVVGATVESEGLFDPDLLTVLKGQYPHLLAEMAAADGFAAFAASGPPYGIILTSTDEGTTAAVVVYEDETAMTGLFANDSTAAIEWARSELYRLGSDATVVTGDLAALNPTIADGLGRAPGTRTAADRSSASGSATPPGTAVDNPLPIDLETEGFVRLSDDYLDTHGQASPEISWRTGFTLAEVYADHHLDRQDAEGRSVTERLLESLRDGVDIVVLGPPGAGKSTICMAVACEWYDRRLGPVLYRERSSGDGFDSAPLLEAYLRRTDDHALVVVEDSVRDEANAIFDVMQALDADPTVTVLLDARTHEWHNHGTFDIDARRDAYRRRVVEERTVPALDERECERFVAHFADLVGTDLDVSGAELFAMVDEGTPETREDGLPAGQALVVQHYLARRYDPVEDIDPAAATALDEAVRGTYRSLADAETPLATDLAVLVALLTAAGIPVAPEYLYAVTGEDEYDEGAVEAAISLLEGRFLFEPDEPQPRSTTYRTRHETWAVRFLGAVLDLESTEGARSRFGQVVSRLLSLADDTDRRTRIQRQLAGRTPHIHRIEADPGGWADELVERLFGVGRTDASLAPLFGETADGTITLPEACSAWTRLQQSYWRGKMNRTHGDFARAEREYRTLGDLARSLELRDEEDEEPAAPDFTSSQAIRGDAPTAHRTRWRATSRTNLGLIAVERGELEAAEEHHEEALALFREIGDREGEARCLKHLGRAAFYASDYDRAREWFEDGLATAREVDARLVEFGCLMDVGAVAVRQSDFEGARESFERCLALAHDLGERREEAQVLNNLGVVATYGGAFDEGREYWEGSLAIRRELGDRQGEADSVDNIGLVARRRGDHDRAREFHEEALAIRHDVGYRSGQATSLVNLGTVALKEGSLERAEDRFEAALDIFEDIGETKGIAEVRLGQGRLALARESVDEARDRASTALESFEELGLDLWMGRGRHLLGRVVAADGNPDEACEHWRTALETFEEIGAPPDALETLAELVETRQDQGDEEGARDWCRRARTVLADAPEPTAALHRDWIERAAAELGVE